MARASTRTAVAVGTTGKAIGVAEEGVLRSWPPDKQLGQDNDDPLGWQDEENGHRIPNCASRETHC